MKKNISLRFIKIRNKETNILATLFIKRLIKISNHAINRRKTFQYGVNNVNLQNSVYLFIFTFPKSLSIIRQDAEKNVTFS